MNSRVPKKSPYRSPLRAEQAAATCQRVLDTATRLFIEQGYAATSIDAIAEAAGVGRSTVFTAAGGKPWLLKGAYDRAVTGDDEPVPLAQHPLARELAEMNDPAQIVARYARFLAEASQRVSAIYDVVRSAADGDDGVRQLWNEIQQQRLAGAGHVAELLNRGYALRKDLSTGYARDIITVYNDPGLHHQLVGNRHWSHDQYRSWLTRTLCLELLA
jgi:AcrR family transcriptional regulator